MNFKCLLQQSIICGAGVLLGLQVAVEGEKNWTGNIGNRVLETKRIKALFLKYSPSIKTHLKMHIMTVHLQWA